MSRLYERTAVLTLGSYFVANDDDGVARVYRKDAIRSFSVLTEGGTFVKVEALPTGGRFVVQVKLAKQNEVAEPAQTAKKTEHSPAIAQAGVMNQVEGFVRGRRLVPRRPYA